MEHEVFISRIHKQSPFNVQAYLRVENDDRNSVLTMPEVQEAISNSNGSKLIVDVITSGLTDFIQYELEVRRSKDFLKAIPKNNYYGTNRSIS